MGRRRAAVCSLWLLALAAGAAVAQDAARTADTAAAAAADALAAAEAASSVAEQEKRFFAGFKPDKAPKKGGCWYGCLPDHCSSGGCNPPPCYGVGNKCEQIHYPKWPPGMQCNRPGCMVPCNNTPPVTFPLAYDYIASNPNLTISTELIDKVGLKEPLSQPFRGTLFVPDNNAWLEYRRDVKVDVTDNTWGDFYRYFFGNLMAYHTLPSRVYAPEFVAGRSYPTQYFSTHGWPHEVVYGSGSTGCPSPTPPRGCPANFLADEQGFTSGFVAVDKFVYGGGVVNIIDRVIQPNDLFPSIETLLKRGVGGNSFGSLLAVYQAVNRSLNVDILNSQEFTTGTLALPNDKALARLDNQNPTPEDLLSILAYFFCPFERQYRLLYTPFRSNKPGKNPCAPWLKRLTNFKRARLAWTFLSNGATKPPDMFITYPSGQFPDGLVNSTANIVYADVSMPFHSAHITDDPILPPKGIKISPRKKM